jgi:hypothetical protein
MSKQEDATEEFDGLNLIPRLLDVGCKIVKQDDQWWIFEHDGEGVVGGATFREMCQKLASVDVAEHERRYLERCRMYMETRNGSWNWQ